MVTHGVCAGPFFGGWSSAVPGEATILRAQWLERLALLAILLLAAYLRLNHLGWTEFKLDEANLSRLALNLVRGVEFPLTGIGSSTGIVNLPLAAWLLALPYAVSSNPVVATAFVALLNVAAVAGCYALARRWFSASGGSAFVGGDSRRRQSASGEPAFVGGDSRRRQSASGESAFVGGDSRRRQSASGESAFVGGDSRRRQSASGESAFVGGDSRRRQSASGDASYLIPVYLSALLFAVAPWAIIHSRKIWAQDLLPPFVIAWAWTGWLGFVKSRSRALLGHALALAVCIQLHYSGLWLLPVSLAWAIAFARRIRWKPALAAVAIFVAPFAPFVIADALRGGQNLNRFLEIARQPAVMDDQALHLAWLMITGQEIHSLAGPQEFQNFLAQAPGGEAGFAFTTIIGVLVLAGGVVALIDVFRAARRRSFDERAALAFMLLTWLALPVLLQSRHSLPVFTHYFIILYPAPFLLVGWLVGWLAGYRGIAGGALRWLLALGVVAIAVLQSAQSIALQQFVATRATPGGYGAPLEASIRLADAIAQASQDLNGAAALIYTEGDRPLSDEAPAVLDVLLPPAVRRRFVDLAQAVIVYPRDASVIVLHSPQGLTLPPGVAQRASPYRREGLIPLRAGEASSQVLEWSGQAAASPPCSDSAPLGQWQNGVALLDVRSSGEWQGSGGWIELCYRAGSEQRQADYHWFTHLIGPDGQRWGQVDGSGYPAQAWRPGDVIALRFGPFTLPLDAPSGRYHVRIGMYTYPEIVNVPVLDSGGNPVGDYVDVALGDLWP